VSREGRSWISHKALAHAAGEEASARDQDGRFPKAAFEALRRLGVTGRPPLASDEAQSLFRILAAVGRGDLSAARIFEGHLNALLLIRLFGSEAQQEQHALSASCGDLFGIWNTDVPGEMVTLGGRILRGKKNFASGVDGINHALITAQTPQGRQLVIVSTADLEIDRSWWHPLGMRASGSHVVNFQGTVLKDQQLIGAPDDYLKEPWFSAGAIRFAAVHVGGMHAILDVVTAHLNETGRKKNPHQQHRLGEMGISVGAGYAWLDHAAKMWSAIGTVSDNEVIALLCAARLAIERSALDVLELAERSVGAAGMIAPHPLERLIRDLRTYLRQPNPDAALATVGAAVANDLWDPSRTC
jgi:alkylation response protein AidB-like acyl-CoA dehydrogenase